MDSRNYKFYDRMLPPINKTRKRNKLSLVKGYTATTGVIAFFIVFGLVGGLETDLITPTQTLTRAIPFLIYMIAMRITYFLANKKAHRSSNSDRATNKNIQANYKTEME